MKRLTGLNLGLMDLDLAMFEPKPDISDANCSVSDKVKFKKIGRDKSAKFSAYKMISLILFVVVSQLVDMLGISWIYGWKFKEWEKVELANLMSLFMNTSMTMLKLLEILF